MRWRGKRGDLHPLEADLFYFLVEAFNLEISTLMAWLRCLRATIALKRSKSDIWARATRASESLEEAEADHLPARSNSLQAFSSLGVRIPRWTGTTNSVRATRFKLMTWRETPWTGPSTITRLASTISTITAIFPFSSPWLIFTTRPVCTKRVKRVYLHWRVSYNAHKVHLKFLQFLVLPLAFFNTYHYAYFHHNNTRHIIFQPQTTPLR